MKTTKPLPENTKNFNSQRKKPKTTTQSKFQIAKCRNSNNPPKKRQTKWVSATRNGILGYSSLSWISDYVGWGIPRPQQSHHGRPCKPSPSTRWACSWAGSTSLGRVTARAPHLGSGGVYQGGTGGHPQRTAPSTSQVNACAVLGWAWRVVSSSMCATSKFPTDVSISGQDASDAQDASSRWLGESAETVGQVGA